MNNIIIHRCTVLYRERSQMEAGHVKQYKEVWQHHLATAPQVKAMQILTAAKNQ
jgi:hypothetical protein